MSDRFAGFEAAIAAIPRAKRYAVSIYSDDEWRRIFKAHDEGATLKEILQALGSMHLPLRRL